MDTTGDPDGWRKISADLFFEMEPLLKEPSARANSSSLSLPGRQPTDTTPACTHSGGGIHGCLSLRRGR